MKILIFAGSKRKDSFNKQAALQAQKIADELGATTTYIDLKDYDMPMYDGDEEASNGLPENALKLKALFKDHQALIISSPEYNSSIPPLLKNVIDWVSRPVEGEQSMEAFTNKTALLMSASPGGLGGLRAQYAVRYLLQNIGVLTLPEFITIGKAHESLPNLDDKTKDKLKSAISKLITIASALHINTS